MQLYSIERPEGLAIETGEVVYGIAISAANILRDIREHITNTLGGHMTRYEKLAAETIERALADLRKNAETKGYDGVVGVRLDHPRIVEGAIGVVAYGTGFRSTPRSQPPR